MAKQLRRRKPVLKCSAEASIELEIQITDPYYEVTALTDDFRYERAWVEGTADKQGWRKLVYSADGRTGDPWQVGKVRITVGRLSNVTTIGT